MLTGFRRITSRVSLGTPRRERDARPRLRIRLLGDDLDLTESKVAERGQNIAALHPACRRLVAAPENRLRPVQIGRATISNVQALACDWCRHSILMAVLVEIMRPDETPVGHARNIAN